ncbi:MAG: DUF4445 domain-containing protein [Phycisphaerae bacterium]|nr:DUF4445 domain-containing protein [Phycisphaerae bacterium]
MAEQYTVTFQPDGVSAEVEAGATILDAANKCGVFVNSLCGGDGVCGKCRVIVLEGQVRSATTEALTLEDIQGGYALACRGRVESDLVVEVPEESRLGKDAITADHEEVGFSETSLVERYELELCPLVSKHYLELQPPSLDSNTADLERLEHALSKQTATREYQMGLKVIQRLPATLRQADWKVTATTAYRVSLTEIIDVQAGDTTGQCLGVAVDIGTTTIAAHLMDLTTSKTQGAASKYNSQIRYGSDVIRRIMYAGQSHKALRDLQDTVVTDINDLVRQLVHQAGASHEDVLVMTAAGNTTMMHLLAAIPPDWIRREPYVGVAYTPPPARAAELGIRISPRGLMYELPSVAAFVGADISAGVLATRMHQSDEPRMLIDIGTNGEVVIGNRDFLVCASTSAGPAFEGAESEAGMRASGGAIDHVTLSDAGAAPSYTTVDSAPPIGICGTGYIDLLAELLSVGLMDKMGRLRVDACDRIRTDERGVAEYVVASANGAGGSRDIVVTQEDIANLLRAKGAVYAGARVMLNGLGMTFGDLAEIMVAGAFGNYLNIDSAITIGLLPDVPLEKLRFVGNTSLLGAKLAAVSRQKYVEVEKIAGSMTYFELSTDPTFMDQFSSACFFPHTDIEEFPRVMARMQNSGKEVGR